MRTLLIAFLMTLATQAGAEYGKLCDREWWEQATTADFNAELNSGADVMARDEDGGTPLHWAAGSGTPENIQVLLEAGADVMATRVDGQTPLHSAAWFGNSKGILVLLVAGAEPKAKNQYGQTPWDLAQDNEELKGTEAYWALNDARFKQGELKPRVILKPIH